MERFEFKTLKTILCIPLKQQFWEVLVFMSGIYYIAGLLLDLIGMKSWIEYMGYSCVVISAFLEGMRVEFERNQ